MIQPRCGFFLRTDEANIGVEIYDYNLLTSSLNTPEFSEYCRDLAQIYGMKPDEVEGLVYLKLFFEKARKLNLSPEEVMEKLKSAGLRIERIPEDQ